ncbi:MAG: murein L,D-transpeptidase catalytic domain family protein [Deltaproteobacteria bacterium]|nr:murein L,D-transpeptidase catalytic domain family protein [Deltaproteobacteria bacterium]
MLRVVLDDTLEDSGTTDVDVQLLADHEPDTCLARGDRVASAFFDGEFAWVALDSFVYLDGTVGAGAFSASFTFTAQGERSHADLLAAAGVAPAVAELAARAYGAARDQGLTDSDVYSVIDFSRPSTERRLWIVNLATGALVKNDRVSHGSGSNSASDPAMASSFSNTPGSNQSSLGLSRFAETYQGSHGYSLRIDGLEDSNDNMRSRAIVMHGASYAEDAFVADNGYLGRSNGCPAVAQSRSASTIDVVKEGTLLFSYFPDDDWLTSSTFLQE